MEWLKRRGRESRRLQGRSANAWKAWTDGSDEGPACEKSLECGYLYMDCLDSGKADALPGRGPGKANPRFAALLLRVRAREAALCNPDVGEAHARRRSLRSLRGCRGLEPLLLGNAASRAASGCQCRWADIVSLCWGQLSL